MPAGQHLSECVMSLMPALSCPVIRRKSEPSLLVLCSCLKTLSPCGDEQLHKCTIMQIESAEELSRKLRSLADKVQHRLWGRRPLCWRLERRQESARIWAIRHSASYPAGSIQRNIRSETPTLTLGYDSWGTECFRFDLYNDLSVPTGQGSLHNHCRFSISENNPRFSHQHCNFR